MAAIDPMSPASPELDLAALLEGPGLEAPPGVLPNLVDPYSFKDWILFTLIFCLTISTILITIRMYTRGILTKSIGPEDWTCLIAFIVFAAYCGIGFRISERGGIHQWNVALKNVIWLGRLCSAAATVYSVNVLFIKMSLLQQYLRIFVPTRNKVYYITYIIIVLNILFYFAIAMATIFECIPREKIWNPLIPGKCISFNHVLIVNGSVNVASDFAILALPICSVWRLQIARSSKIAISAVFAVGLFACIASIMRLVQSVHMTHSEDLTYDLVIVYLWTVAEVCSGILCCCLPVIPQFFRHFVPMITSSLRSSFERKSSPSYPSENSKQSGTHGTTSSEADPSLQPKGPYLELNEMNAKQSPDRVGVQPPYGSDTRVFSDGRDEDLERGVAGLGGIQRTTTVEQYHYRG